MLGRDCEDYSRDTTVTAVDKSAPDHMDQSEIREALTVWDAENACEQPTSVPQERSGSLILRPMTRTSGVHDNLCRIPSFGKSMRH